MINFLFMLCGLINSGSDLSCDNLSGTEATCYFVNWDDIQEKTKVDGRVLSITLKPGKTAYIFTGLTNDVKISQETIPTRRERQIKHNLGITIYDRTFTQKMNMKQLSKGLFFVIVKFKGQDDDSIVVVGYDVGLVHQPYTVNDAYLEGGNYLFNFATEEYESDFVASLGTDYQDGLDIIDSLFPQEYFIELEDSLFLVEREDDNGLILIGE
jgi:hypothetical protein